MKFIYDIIYLIESNTQYYLVLLLIFLGVTIALFTILFVFVRKHTISGQLAKALAPASKKPKQTILETEESNSIYGRFSNILLRLNTPAEESDRKYIRKNLLQAGFRSKRAFRLYLTTKVIFPFLLAISYLIKTSFYKIDYHSIATCLLLFAGGFFLPDLFIRQVAQKRKEGLIRSLPDALDLMVVCVESGLGLDMTFKKVGDEMKTMNKDLSEEFHLTNLEIRAGKPRDEAFKNMALRTGVPEIGNLMTMLSQANRFGTSIATALRVHADAMRIKRRQMAEERAAKAVVKIVFPLALFIFPAIFIILLGPAGIRVYKVVLPALGG